MGDRDWWHNIEGIAKRIETFMSRVHFAESGCWEWTGYVNPDGYGGWTDYRRFKRRNGSCNIGAHKWSYLMFTIDKPLLKKGQVIDHLCRNRKCVNPDHLEAVSCKENLLRGYGICAQNARRTHCKYGHEFTPENTQLNKFKGRVCKQCGRERARNFSRAKKKIPQELHRPYRIKPLLAVPISQYMLPGFENGKNFTRH